jgi:hypothetical protein
VSVDRSSGGVAAASPCCRTARGSKGQSTKQSRGEGDGAWLAADGESRVHTQACTSSRLFCLVFSARARRRNLCLSDGRFRIGRLGCGLMVTSSDTDARRDGACRCRGGSLELDGAWRVRTNIRPCGGRGRSIRSPCWPGASPCIPVAATATAASLLPCRRGIDRRHREAISRCSVMASFPDRPACQPRCSAWATATNPRWLHVRRASRYSAGMGSLRSTREPYALCACESKAHE